MRTYEEYRRILQLWEEGFNKSEIERITQIPRPTVRDCISRFQNLAGLQEYERKRILLNDTLPVIVLLLQDKNCDHNLQMAYAYLLGIYLGDGSISKQRKEVYRLRVSLDAKYPGIIQRCKQTLETLLPDNKMGIVEHYYKNRLSSVDVSCYFKHWPKLLPQHGTGMKHERRIELETWQQRIVDEYPLEFWRGLYHSDGSRFSNVVNGKDYPRYQFTNMSTDIIRLFCETCDKLGIHWTAKKRIPIPGVQSADIFISKRKDVEFLDREIGPKQ